MSLYAGPGKNFARRGRRRIPCPEFGKWLAGLLMALLLLPGFLPASAPAEEVLVDVTPLRCSPVQTRKATGSFSGVLPVPMVQDFTGWSPGVCRTESGVDDFGDRFLRFHIRKAGVQFHIPLPQLRKKEYYKATFVFRNQLTGKLRFYLRRIQEPYNTLGVSFDLPMSSRFLTLEFPFSPETLPENAGTGLFFHSRFTGKFDLKRIRIERISPEEFALLENAKMKQIRRKAPGTVNFLRCSTLPKGLQSGWCQLAGNHQSRSIVEPDPSVTGPSGEAALKLDSSPDESVGIASEPFTASSPEREVTVSFSYRGRGEFSASVLSAGNLIRPRKLAPEEKRWKREVITLRLPPKRLASVLQIVGRGILYVDAFRVAEKGEADYKPSNQHEISFFLSPSEASVSRIQFEDEPPVLNYYLTGDAGDVTVRSSVTDLYGTTVSLTEKTGKRGALSYLQTGKPYGQFRVEAQAFRNGKPVSVVNEMVVTRLPRPLYWKKDAPDSPFGIHTNQLESSIRAMKAGGFNWVRLHDGARHLSCWYFVEPEKGKWRFADKEIKAYRNNHFLLYGQLGGAPAWATELRNLPEFKSEYAKVYFTPLPEHEKEFAAYCRTMAARYKGIINDWFIWNEPWGPIFFHRSYDFRNKQYITYGGKAENAEVYTRLSKLAYRAAKEGNPECRITGFNSYGGIPEWNETIYRNGGYRFCDEIDYHVYYQDQVSGFPGDGLRERMESAFSGILKGEGRLTKPYLMSEGSAGSASVEETEPRIGLYRHSITWHSTEEYHRTADATIRFLLSHLSFGVKRVFLYTSHSYRDLGRGSGLQIMLGADGFPHPTLVAMSAFARRVEDRKFIRYQKLADEVYAALFSDGKRTTAVITGSPIRHARILFRGTFPVQIADLYGNPLSRAEYRGKLLYFNAECPPDVLGNTLKAVPF